MTRTVFLRITGKVQGVFYRATAKDVACSLGLKGWVRNSPDGSVEALASGPDSKIEDFIRWCHCGPDQAVVDSVAIEDSPERSTDSTFRILR